MAKDRNAFKAGSFILVSIVLVFAVVVAVRGLGSFEATQARVVHFGLSDDIGGLRVGDDVRIGGAKVGYVRKIEVVAREQAKLPPAAATQPLHDDPNLIRIEFVMPSRFRLGQDARVSIQSTVTGQSNLNFESLGHPDQMALADGDSLIGRQSGLGAFMATLATVGPDIQSAARQINQQTIPAATGLLADARQQTLPRMNQTIDEVRTGPVAKADGVMADVRTQTVPKVNQLLDDVRLQTVPKVNSAVTNVGEVFGESKNDFKTTVANLSTATGAVKDRLPEILEQVTGFTKKLNDTIVSAQGAIEDVKKTLANTRDATGTVKTILQGNKSKLDGMIAALKTTSDNLAGASAEIRRSPWRLLYKPKTSEMANLNIYDSVRSFADGANDLNDAAEALRDAVQQNPEDGAAIKRLLEQLQRSFSNFEGVEDEFWKRVKE